MKFFDFFRKKQLQPAAPANAVVETLPNGVTLSPELSAYKELIEKTALPFVRIEAKPSDSLSLLQSKFGGRPYWPAGKSYPTDTEGKPMFLLAQLNFSEIPHVEGYPQKGILQFYISETDTYGLDFDDPTNQSTFRIVYFEQADEADAEKEFLFLKDVTFDSVPLNRPMALSFTAATDYVGSCDTRFEDNFGGTVLEFASRFGEKKDKVGDELFESFSSDGHKVGGYAYFTQTDPRDYQAAYHDWVLLLQIDSQDNDIVWGDLGVANFFIHPDDLKRRDFSRVLYNWDCT